MGYKQLIHNLDGTSVFIDTRTKEEAVEENLGRVREQITSSIVSAGYDEIWQRNAGLGLIPQIEVEAGRAFISNLRTSYHDYKARLLAATRDEADKVQWLR